METPNIDALMGGCVSGKATEWHQLGVGVRSPLKNIDTHKILIEDIKDYLSVCGSYDEAAEAEALLERLIKEIANETSSCV